MTDNVSITPGTGAVIATDDVGGVQYQFVKIAVGGNGIANDPAMGAGVVSSTVARVTLASDDPLITTFNAGVGLKAGTSIVGKFGIDQSTPGTTNLVAANLQVAGSAIAAGAGAVSSATPRVTLGSDDPAVAALQTIRDATNTINVAQDTSTIKNGATSLTPKFVAIAASSSGNNTLLAAVTSKKIRVLAYNIIGNGAVNAKFQSGASGTDLTGLKYIAAAGGGICAPFNPVGWFETASNTLLNLNLSGAVAVGGELVYIEV